MKRLSKKRLALLTLCVCSAIANSGFAAATEDIDVYGGDEFVVTATRTKLEAKEVPTTVEIVKQEDIENLGAYNVRDALRLATGIDLRRTGMTGNNVQIRGMDSRHSLILIDGKRAAGEDSAETLNVYELNRINMSDVERIEIIRGAGSALYGSDAMGGVINIITKKADKESFTAGISTGSEEVNEYLNYSTGRVGKLSAKFGARWTKEREQSHYTSSIAHGTNMNGPKRYFDLGLNYAFDEQRGLDLDVRYARERLQAESVMNMGRIQYLSGTNYENDRMDYSLNFYGKTDRHDYNVRSYYSYLKKGAVGNSAMGNAYMTMLNTGTNDRHRFSNWTTEAKDSYKVDDQNTLTYGMEYKHAKSDRDFGVTSTPMMGPSTTVHAGGVHSSNSFAAFVQDEYKPNDKLFIIPALRYDYQNGFGSNVSAKLGATYNMSEASRVKFNIGQGYRTPTLFEMYGDMVKNMMGYEVHVRGDEDLDAEKSLNFDIGLEGERGKSTGKITYFHNKIKNLITTKDDPTKSDFIDDTHFYQVYYNVDKATIQGVEAEATYTFDEHWMAKATYDYLDAVDSTSGERLDNRARHYGTVQLQYSTADEHPLTVTLWNAYTSKYRYSDEDYSFATTNIMINKQINKNFRLYGGVDNIFDKNFENQKTYVLDGRQWRVGAEWTF